MLGHLFETDRMSFDKVVIEPVAFDHEVKNPVKERRVASGLDRQEQIAGSSQGSDAGIDDDDLCAILARLPYVIGRDRGAFRDVRAADPDYFGLKNIRPWVGGVWPAAGSQALPESARRASAAKLCLER